MHIYVLVFAVVQLTYRTTNARRQVYHTLAVGEQSPCGFIFASFFHAFFIIWWPPVCTLCSILHWDCSNGVFSENSVLNKSHPRFRASLSSCRAVMTFQVFSKECSHPGSSVHDHLFPLPRKSRSPSDVFQEGEGTLSCSHAATWRQSRLQLLQQTKRRIKHQQDFSNSSTWNPHPL